MAVSDVQRACDILRPVWDEADQDGGRDGWVSIEVDPNLALDDRRDVGRGHSAERGRRRPNAFVKIPATQHGLRRIEDSIARGIPINVTLIFSLERHRKVCRGVHARAGAAGRGRRRPVRARLGGELLRVARGHRGRQAARLCRGHDDLRGKLAIANAKLAYQAYKEIFTGERWERLQARGATPQRCLWASTSTKNPDYRDVIYVEELIGPNTVNTMPAETITAFQDHGEVRGNTLEDDLDEAHALLDQLAEPGSPTTT